MRARAIEYMNFYMFFAQEGPLKEFEFCDVFNKGLYGI